MLSKDACIRYDLFVERFQSYVYPALTHRINGIASPTRESIVDLGLGPGHLSYSLAKSGWRRVLGVEINDAMIEIATRRLGTLDVVEILKSDAHSLDVPPNSVDAIVSYSCYHHWENPRKVIENCLKILKPGGKIVFFDTLPSFVDRLDSIRPFVPEPEMSEIIEKAARESVTIESVTADFVSVGFSDIDTNVLEFTEEEIMSGIEELAASDSFTDGSDIGPTMWQIVAVK